MTVTKVYFLVDRLNIIVSPRTPTPERLSPPRPTAYASAMRPRAGRLRHRLGTLTAVIDALRLRHVLGNLNWKNGLPVTSTAAVITVFDAEEYLEGRRGRTRLAADRRYGLVNRRRRSGSPAALPRNGDRHLAALTTRLMIGGPQPSAWLLTPRPPGWATHRSSVQFNSFPTGLKRGNRQRKEEGEREVTRLGIFCSLRSGWLTFTSFGMANSAIQLTVAIYAAMNSGCGRTSTGMSASPSGHSPPCVYIPRRDGRSPMRSRPDLRYLAVRFGIRGFRVIFRITTLRRHRRPLVIVPRPQT